MKIIICGAGRVGMSISEHLSNENNDITVIDSKSEALKKITDLYDVQGVLGLASHPSVLKDAGIEDSEMLIALPMMLVSLLFMSFHIFARNIQYEILNRTGKTAMMREIING